MSTYPTELRVSSLVDVLHSAVREQILNSQLAAGTSWTEVDIAARFNVARPTAKAAMERLIQEGLLTRTSKTTRVPLLDVRDVRDLYYTRGFLEREVMVALAAVGTVPDQARQSSAELLAHADALTPFEVVAHDVGFHRALVSELRSPRLERLYSSLMGEVHLCMAQVQEKRLLHPASIAEEHEAILRAIEAKDAARAVSEIDHHLDRACTLLTGALEDRADER
jgi:DNA-binding GntR family transcriptional regulator